MGPINLYVHRPYNFGGIRTDPIGGGDQSECTLKGTVHTDEKLEERFRQVGGVPWHGFFNKNVYMATLQLQMGAIQALLVVVALGMFSFRFQAQNQKASCKDLILIRSNLEPLFVCGLC
jgi:hypothetical protein